MRGRAHRHGLVARGARPPAARPATAGSRCRRWSPRPTDLRAPTARPAPTLAGFVAELDRRAHEQHAPVAEGVTLATLHAAKGLEWDAVFLCGMQEGSMPITYADTPAAVEEERRLLYVGITRARKHLWVSWALARNPGGQARRRPSRFLAGLRPESATDRADAAGPPRGARRRGKKAAVCKQCQKPLASSRERNRGYCQDCPVPYDEELFELAALLAQGAGRGAERARRSWCSPTPPSRRSPRSSRPTAQACSRSTASARPSSRSTPTTCSRILG